MTSLRGPPRRTTRGEQSAESYLLLPTHLWSEDTANRPEEEVDPESDAALLRKRRDEEDDDDGENQHFPIIKRSNILRRLITFMSQVPLLPGSSQAPEIFYGALSANGPTGSTDIDEEEEEDNEVSRKGRRKGKSSDGRHVDTVRPTRSMGTLQSHYGVRSTRSMGTLRSQTGSVSISRRHTRRSEPAPGNIYASGTGLPTGDGAKLFEGLAPTMSTEHLDIEEEDEEGADEEAVLVDGEESGDDDEDPSDNSPLVHCSFDLCALSHERVSMRERNRSGVTFCYCYQSRSSAYSSDPDIVVILEYRCAASFDYSSYRLLKSYCMQPG